MSDINEMNVGLRWYVVHTYSGYENKVKANLEKIVENRGLGHLIYEIRIPTETVVTRKENGEEKIEEIKESSSYSASYDAVCKRVIDTVDDGECEDYASLRAAADALSEANATLFEEVVKYLNTAADSLEKYELYK